MIPLLSLKRCNWLKNASDRHTNFITYAIGCRVRDKIKAPLWFSDDNANVFSAAVMLWPLFILGFVVLVTSWPSASTLAENLNDATWRELTEMFPQKSLQWMSSYNPESAGPGIIIDYLVIWWQFFSFMNYTTWNDRIIKVNDMENTWKDTVK